jgi:hypothetical protein
VILGCRELEGRDVIEESAVFVICDDKDALLPSLCICSDCIVDATQERLSGSNRGRGVVVVGTARQVRAARIGGFDEHHIGEIWLRYKIVLEPRKISEEYVLKVGGDSLRNLWHHQQKWKPLMIDAP